MCAHRRIGVFAKLVFFFPPVQAPSMILDVEVVCGGSAAYNIQGGSSPPWGFCPENLMNSCITIAGAAKALEPSVYQSLAVFQADSGGPPKLLPKPKSSCSLRKLHLHGDRALQLPDSNRPWVSEPGADDGKSDQFAHSLLVVKHLLATNWVSRFSIISLI